MRMSNPALRSTLSQTQNGNMSVETQPATHKGIAQKTVLYAAITIIAAIATVLLLNYAVKIESGALISTLAISAVVGSVVMLILSFVIMFVPSACNVLGSIYAVCQGILLGLVVCMVNTVLPGVAFAAILGTMIVFVLTIVLNKYLGVRISNKFWRAMAIAFLSLFVVELATLVIYLVNPTFAIFSNWWIQLIATMFCVFYAAIMLMWDLQTADEIVQFGADKKYEWLVAFSLVTTLVYLYLEILELLIRLIAIFGDRS